MKFLGIFFCEGFKLYNKPQRRMTEHPALVFKNEENGKHYFINFSTDGEASKRDVMRASNGQTYVLFATDVWAHGKKWEKYPMNLLSTIAVVDEKYVVIEDKENAQEYNQNSSVLIKRKYKIGNFCQFIQKTTEFIVDSSRQAYCYNANPNDYEYCDFLEDTLSVLPHSLIGCCKSMNKEIVDKNMQYWSKVKED